jgi:hypothetical protein
MIGRALYNLRYCVAKLLTESDSPMVLMGGGGKGIVEDESPSRLFGNVETGCRSDWQELKRADLEFKSAIEHSQLNS